MSTASPAPSTPDEPDAARAWERALLDRQLAALDRLAEMGMAIAAAVERRVTAEAVEGEPAAALHHAAMDFARASRAVRMTFALQSRLIAEFKGEGRAPSGRAPSAREAWEAAREEAARKLSEMSSEEIDRLVLGPDWPPPPEWQRRHQVLRIVRNDVILAGGPGARRVPEIERLEHEAKERIERDDIALDILNRPIGEIVAIICRDIGLEPDWDAIAETEWAKAEIADGPPAASPFAAWLASREVPAPQAASP
jgi:hypothetical protein